MRKNITGSRSIDFASVREATEYAEEVGMQLWQHGDTLLAIKNDDGVPIPFKLVPAPDGDVCWRRLVPTVSRSVERCGWWEDC